MWAHPARPQTEPVRIGDQERDEALDTLGEHFAAGRLSREEFDERAEQAIGARFDRDLAALFRDLPDRRPREVVVVRPSRPRAVAVLPVAFTALLPLLVLAAVASVVLHAPVLVGPLIWLLVLSGLGRRHHPR